MTSDQDCSNFLIIAIPYFIFTPIIRFESSMKSSIGWPASGETVAVSPLGRRHLRRPFPGFGGIKDEFERVIILVLLHEFEVDEPLRFGYRPTARKPSSGRFQERRRELVLTVGNHAFQRLGELP